MTKRFVAVGINDYSILDSTARSNLSSCVADATSMAGLLVSAFGFDPGMSISLTDRQASSSNIKSAIRSMLSQSAPGDVACFFYSGHGARTPAAPSRGDCDAFYESIIPASGDPILDRDLFALADALQPSAINFTVILDSCHSGGMDQETDRRFKCKSPILSQDLLLRMERYLRTLIPCGILISPTSLACVDNVTLLPTAVAGHPGIEEDPDKVFVEEAKTTLIAGCGFDELSWEIAGHGLLTNAILDLVDAGDFEINHIDLLDRLRTKVGNTFAHVILPHLSSGEPRRQTPQLRGQKSRMEENFLQGFTGSE